MVQVTFALVREGSSDDGLVPHLRELLIRAGIDEVSGSSRPYKGPVAHVLEQVAAEEVLPGVVFVHRDTDSTTSAVRRQQILSARSVLAMDPRRIVPVVPVQELEAWLLLDEAAIRAVAGRTSGKVPLGLPALKSIEETKSPKEVLKAACLIASETTGRRYKDEKRKFSAHRRALLERLDIDGPVSHLPAWRQLEEDTAAAAKAIT